MRNYLIERYELLQIKADRAFEDIEKDFKSCVRCKTHCSDCCHALFGLFLIEAVYLKFHFDRLSKEKREEAVSRAIESDEDLKILEKKLRARATNSQISSHSLATERIRCPLLDKNEECILYPNRPITCRVYGIPTAIQGKAHVCGKSRFEAEKSYPTFNLDAAYSGLYDLSKQLLQWEGGRNPEKASLMVSVSKTITTPVKNLLSEVFL